MTSSTGSTETATAIISSGSAIYPNGCVVVSPDGEQRTEWKGRVYILPDATYKSLLLTNP